ncbi:MAG: transposase [Candidatus Eisenbacteria bacterium]
MTRVARVVVPDIPHHVAQRGNRRQQTFFCDSDYRAYIRIMSEFCSRHEVAIWAYCLMPNHVHLVAVPATMDGLRLAIGKAHRHYTFAINARMEWKGHLWQGRFASCPLDERHLLAAVRYIEQNPVRADLVKCPEEWPWSSAGAHLSGRDDDLVSAQPVLEIMPHWEEFLRLEVSRNPDFGRHERTGRPLGDEAFIDCCERATNRTLRPRKRGPRPSKKYRIAPWLNMASPRQPHK